MLKVGTRIRWHDGQVEGVITKIDEDGFDILWENSEQPMPMRGYYKWFAQREGSSAYLELVRPPVTPYPAQAVRNADANLSYAKAVGSMESRLAMVYNTIVRAITLNDGEHTASVAWNLNWIRERVESTADYVASIATPSGVPSLTYLRDEIARQRSNFTTDTPEEN